jgi:hypothetical protein
VVYIPGTQDFIFFRQPMDPSGEVPEKEEERRNKVSLFLPFLFYFYVPCSVLSPCSSLFPLPSSLFPLPSSLFPLPSSLFPLSSSSLPTLLLHLPRTSLKRRNK